MARSRASCSASAIAGSSPPASKRSSCAAARAGRLCLPRRAHRPTSWQMTIERYEVGPRMGQAVVYRGVAYLAGIVADDLVPSVADQTRQILAKIDRLLAAVGSDKTRILKANIWLSDIGRFGEMNAVWDGWVAKGDPP